MRMQTRMGMQIQTQMGMGMASFSTRRVRLYLPAGVSGQFTAVQPQDAPRSCEASL